MLFTLVVLFKISFTVLCLCVLKSVLPFCVFVCVSETCVKVWFDYFKGFETFRNFQTSWQDKTRLASLEPAETSKPS